MRKVLGKRGVPCVVQCCRIHPKNFEKHLNSVFFKCLKNIYHTVMLKVTFKPKAMEVLEMTGDPTMEYSISAY